MEKLMYEARPYVYGALSFYALFLSHNSTLMIVSGLALACCCAKVASLRIGHRAQVAIINRKINAQKKR